MISGTKISESLGFKTNAFIRFSLTIREHFPKLVLFLIIISYMGETN